MWSDGRLGRATFAAGLDHTGIFRRKGFYYFMTLQDVYIKICNV